MEGIEKGGLGGTMFPRAKKSGDLYKKVQCEHRRGA